MYSSPKGEPFSSTTASLSASGSTAKPTSALFLITTADNSERFSGNGSVPLENIPFLSQFNFITSQPSDSNIRGNASDPAPFTESITTLYFLFLICLISIHFNSVQLSECLYKEFLSSQIIPFSFTYVLLIL